jgi:hypothetical protein
MTPPITAKVPIIQISDLLVLSLELDFPELAVAVCTGASDFGAPEAEPPLEPPSPAPPTPPDAAESIGIPEDSPDDNAVV